MYLLAVLTLCFYVVDSFPFLPLSALKDCPHVTAQPNIQVDQITGSWRLAYLFYDEQDDIEEDGTCIVTEFSPENSHLLNIAIHMDFKGSDFMVDRTSFDLSASFHSPGEWLLHSSLSDKSYLHVTVVSLTKKHMILTFCISNGTNTENFRNKEDLSYSYILQKLRNENLDGPYFKKAERTFDDISALFERGNYLIRKRRSPPLQDEDSFANEIKSVMSNIENEKHFWTIILVKDNDVSSLNFVENASLLMKYGFDMRKGNLVSFGKCGI